MDNTSDCIIPHVDIPAGEFKAVIDEVRAANVLLLSHAQRLYGADATARKLREALFRGELMPHQVGIGYEDGVAIFAARRHEERVICHHVNLLKKVANKAARCYTKRVQTDDLIMEGVLAVREAMYNYRRDDVKFITYVTWVVVHAVYNAVAGDTDLGGVKEDGRRLLRTFRKVQGESKHLSFEEMMTVGGFSEEQRREIHRLTRSVCRDGDTVDNDKGLNSASLADHRGDDVENAIDRKSATLHLKDALARVCLSDFERDVLMASVNGGTAATVAKKYGYRRQATTQALRRAKKKLGEVLRHPRVLQAVA